MGKFIVYFFLITLALFLLLIVFLRFFLPQEQIKLYTEQSLSQALERPVNIRKLQVNPFGSIIIRDVSIIQGTTREENVDTLFQVKKVILKYKFFSLFKRRVWISQVLIDSPAFYLVPAPDKAISKDSISITQPQPETVPSKKKNDAVSLPFTFLMSQFELKDCTFSLSGNAGADKPYFVLQGVNLTIARVNLPRNFQKARRWIRGQIRLFTREGGLTLRTGDNSYRFKTDVDIMGAFKSLSTWNVSGSIKMGRQVWDKALWPSLTIDIDGQNFTDILTINQASLHTEKLNFVDLTGSILFLKQYDVTINSSTIDINNFLITYRNIFSDFGLDLTEVVNINGFLSPIKGSIQGRVDSLQLKTESQLNVDRLLFMSDSSFMDKGFSRINVSGITNLTHLEKLVVKGNFGFDSYIKNINDTLQFKTGVFAGAITTTLDSQGFPYTGILHCSLNEMAQGTAELKINWIREGKSNPGLDTIAFRGVLQADSVNLTQIPISLPNIKGRAGLNLTVFSRGGFQNRVVLHCRFDSVQYNRELIGDEVNTLQTNIFFHTDSSRAELSVDTCIVSIDKLLTSNIRGNYHLQKGEYKFDLDQLTIDNTELATYLPETQKKNMELSGYETIKATLKGKSRSDTSSYSFTARVDFNQAGFNLLPEQILVRGLQGDIGLQGNLKHFSGIGNLVAPAIRIPGIRTSPFNHTSLDFKGEVRSFNEFFINRFDLASPSLGLRGNLTGSLQNLDTAFTSLKGAAHIEFDSADTVEIVNDILIKGNLAASLQVETYDSSHNGITVSGQLKADSLTVRNKDGFRVKYVKSSIPFSINYDLKKKTLFSSRGDSIHIKKNYQNDRFLYRSLLPEIGRLQLQTVEVGNYRIDSMDMDILFQGNNIQLPWIGVNIFGGNFAGALNLDLNSGKLNDINYTITGNANRINSTMISRVRQKHEKKSEVDATFNFQGRGLDISEMIDVSGFFHIINMGSDFASNLLSSIDPSGSDRSIKMTKQLINRGWKPGIFSFELRHGYVYPSFNLHQPWFSPVRLPERLEYGRLPLSFFLKSK